MVICWQEPDTGWKAWHGQHQSAGLAGFFLQGSLRAEAFGFPKRALGPDSLEQASAGKASKEQGRWETQLYQGKSFASMYLQYMGQQGWLLGLRTFSSKGSTEGRRGKWKKRDLCMSGSTLKRNCEPCAELPHLLIYRPLSLQCVSDLKEAVGAELCGGLSGATHSSCSQVCPSNNAGCAILPPHT